MIDWDVLKKLIQLVKDEDISGLSVEEKGVKYDVRREGGRVIASPAPIAHAIPQAPAQIAPIHAPTATEEEGLIAITSPMVGTFYRTPSPESPAFVEVGDSVQPGKVVCIIEAMKLFNEIEAEVSGKIVKVLVESGKPVEYGQKLFLIKKA
ncbi:MAG: acetyl-CoA carboxylase biotin carboxyl carrier protein [Candidatus Margulisiibacteriota bacterium]|jgi:acetyl-CoA carboxylase biotin carboxyl carrier protein